MKGWKIASLISFLLLIVSNLLWAYLVFDQAISYTYLKTSYDDQTEIIRWLGGIVVKGAESYSKKDIVHLLRQSKPDAFIVEEDDLIVFEGIHFLFSDGKLVEVK